MRINKTLLDKVSLKQISKTTFYRNDALKGFGLRVSPGGTCAFIVEKRVQGKVKRITLRTFPALTCEQARKAAHQRLAEMALGVDPKAQEKAEQARNITLEELLADYLVTHSEIKSGEKKPPPDFLMIFIGY